MDETSVVTPACVMESSPSPASRDASLSPFPEKREDVSLFRLLGSHLSDIIIPNFLMSVTSSLEMPLVTLLGRQYGFPRSAIAQLIALVALSRAIMDIPWGILIDVFGLARMIISSILFNILAAMVGFYFCTRPVLIVFAVLSGSTLGGFFLNLDVFTARVIPRRYRGTVMSTISGVVRWAHVLGPSLSGVIITYTGDVRYAFWLSAGTAALTSMSLLYSFRPRRSFPVREQRMIGEDEKHFRRRERIRGADLFSKTKRGVPESGGSVPSRSKDENSITEDRLSSSTPFLSSGGHLSSVVSLPHLAIPASPSPSSLPPREEEGGEGQQTKVEEHPLTTVPRENGAEQATEKGAPSVASAPPSSATIFFSAGDMRGVPCMVSSLGPSSTVPLLNDSLPSHHRHYASSLSSSSPPLSASHRPHEAHTETMRGPSPPFRYGGTDEEEHGQQENARRHRREREERWGSGTSPAHSPSHVYFHPGWSHRSPTSRLHRCLHGRDSHSRHHAHPHSSSSGSSARHRLLQAFLFYYHFSRPSFYPEGVHYRSLPQPSRYQRTFRYGIPFFHHRRPHRRTRRRNSEGHVPHHLLDTAPPSPMATTRTTASRGGVHHHHHHEVLVSRPPFPFLSFLMAHLRTILLLGCYVIFFTGLRANRKLMLTFAGMDANWSDAQLSFLLSFGFSVDAVLFPLGGVVMDRFGRQWAMVPVTLGYAFSFVLLTLATTGPLLLAASALFGLADSLGCGLIKTLVADRAPPHWGSPFFGIMRMLEDVGHVLGAAGVGRMLHVLGFTRTCWSLAIIGVATALWGILLIPPAAEEEEEGEERERQVSVCSNTQSSTASRSGSSSSSTSTGSSLPASDSDRNGNGGMRKRSRAATSSISSSSTSQSLLAPQDENPTTEAEEKKVHIPVLKEKKSHG